MNGICYAAILGNRPGERIGIVKTGERGYYPAKGYDYAPHTIEEVKVKVSDLNKTLEVPDDVAESAAVGSMFGWDCPGAQKAVEFFQERR